MSEKTPIASSEQNSYVKENLIAGGIQYLEDASSMPYYKLKELGLGTASVREVLTAQAVVSALRKADSFKFKLKDKVIIQISGEDGDVVGRAEYIDCGNNYMLRYKQADGVAIEKWWPESALGAA